MYPLFAEMLAVNILYYRLGCPTSNVKGHHVNNVEVTVCNLTWVHHYHLRRVFTVPGVWFVAAFASIHPSFIPL